MIRYALICEGGHRSEGWFRNGDDFDRQAAAGAVSCPACGSVSVGKALMAPALGGGRKSEAAQAENKSEPPKMQLAAPDPRHAALREMLREVRKHVTENADYVGERFADEARKIHYQEAEPRGIYGEASPEEARALLEEGIEVHPLPILPEERN